MIVKRGGISNLAGMVCAAGFLFSVGVAQAWEGARLRRIEPPTRPEAVRKIQVPILSYDPVQPQVDREGRVWLSEKNGTIRVLLPYGGEIASWHLAAGVEAATLEDADGARLALNRDGQLVRLDPARPATFVTVANGLPGGVGPGCRLRGHFFWTDAQGGVVVTDRDGNVLQRVADVLFARKRYRGGAVALCGDNEAIVGVAGGKVARFGRNGLTNALTPPALEGVSFAPRGLFYTDRDWRAIICTHRNGCFGMDKDGNVATFTDTGSFDGPADVGSGRFVVAQNDGRLALFSRSGELIRDVPLGAGPYWLLRKQDGRTAAANGKALWLVNSGGDLVRVSGLLSGDASEPAVDRVLSVPSGFGGGGLVLPDHTALLRTNYGATYILEIR